MRYLMSFLLSSSAIASFATPTCAQVANEGLFTGDEAGVIIVQARRRDEDVQDVPAVINTVTSEEIARLNLRNFKEVSSLVPGLQLTTEDNGIGGNARLRGVNFDVTASGNNPTVEFYFNDAPISAGVILQQMYDVGQVEVQRGPQGTLRGRAAPSGSITIGARKPDLYGIGGTVDMTGNTIGTLNFRGALNIPVIEGVAAIRVAGVWDENEGDRVRSIHAARDPFARTKSGRISALVQPTDWLKLEGLYQRLDRVSFSYNQIASFSEANPSATPSPRYISTSDRLSIQETPRRIDQKYEIFNWRAEASGFGQVLIYQGQHYTQKIRSMENVDNADFFPGDVMQNTYSHPASTSHEVRLQNQSRVFDFLDYVVGFFDNKNDAPTELTQATIIGAPVSATRGRIITTAFTPVARIGGSHEQSFFGNLTAHLGEKAELSGGLRHITYTSENQTIVNGRTISTDGQDDKKWIYSASAKYNFTPDLMVYVSTGSSYRPGINVVGNFSLRRSALEDSFLNLPPETSKSYEAGIKTTLLGGKVQANLTGFHQKFKNYPYRGGGKGVYYVNTVAVRNAQGQVTGTAEQVSNFNFVGAVPVEVNGLEGELSVSLSDRWSLGVVAAYSLGKIKNGVIPCTDLNRDGSPDVINAAPNLEQLKAVVGADNISACQVSQRSGFQSPFSATLTSEYTVPVSDSMNAYLRGLVNFNGRSRVDPTNIYDDISSYGLANLFLGVRDRRGAWEVSLFAKNIFDTDRTLTRADPYATNYLIPTGQTTTRAATFNGTYTPVTMTSPREFGLNVRYSFGAR